MKFIERAASATVRELSGQFPAIMICGARQVGKTTLLRNAAEDGRKFVSLDDPDVRTLARTDPALFLQAYPPPIIIDEIQYVPELLPYIKAMKLRNLSIAAPDMGGAKRANTYAKSLGGRQECGVIICHKTRERANVVAEIKAIGEVEGRNIIIVDDMIDTAGTLCKAADVLKEKGAASVRCCATHGILSGNAVEKIHNSALEEVFITDTIPHPELEGDSKIRIVSMSQVFASIIEKVYNYEPISPDFVY